MKDVEKHRYYDRGKVIRRNKAVIAALWAVIVILAAALIAMSVRALEMDRAAARAGGSGLPEVCRAAAGQEPERERPGPAAACAAPLRTEPEEDKIPPETWFRDDIALGVEDQKLLHDATMEFGVRYELMLAVCEQETGFRNIMGDGGNSYGYMQIQPRWWSGVMAEIGARDLLDPRDNFRTACAIMARLLGQTDGDTGEALSLYNTGKTGTSPYAEEVMARMRKCGS